MDYFHLSTTLNPISLAWETYVNYGQGSPGMGRTPVDSIQDWIAKVHGYFYLYRTQTISIGKLGEMLGISLEQTKQLLKNNGICLNMDA